jgi:DNA-binding transcriptional ArsR family regulator
MSADDRADRDATNDAAEVTRPARDVLPEGVPVEMPPLPAVLRVTSEQQFKALGDPIRGRILQMVHFRPSTAKQIATALGASPGAIGHHLRVLEDAGFVQVVARRLINNLTIAKYYARTAATFVFDFRRELTGDTPTELVLLDQARDELLAALPLVHEGALLDAWFPHRQLSPGRMRLYLERIVQLVSDFLSEAPDPDGHVYSLFITTYRSPLYVQPPHTSDSSAGTGESTPHG